MIERDKSFLGTRKHYCTVVHRIASHEDVVYSDIPLNMTLMFAAM